MTAEEIHDGMFTKYVKPSSSLYDNWCFKELPHGRNENDEVRSLLVIKDLVDAGYKVKAGWSGASMCRSFKIFRVFWK